MPVHNPISITEAAAVPSVAVGVISSIESTERSASPFADARRRVQLLDREVVEREWRDANVACQFLRARSDQGDDDATYLLAMGLLMLRFDSHTLLDEGKCRWRTKSQEALSLLASCASRHHPLAMAELGQLRLVGWGCAADLPSAKCLLLGAGRLGDDRSLLTVADRVRAGELLGTANEAMDLYIEVCERKFLPGIMDLADRLAHGDGFPKDESGAAQWLRKGLALEREPLTFKCAIELQTLLRLRPGLRQDGDELLIRKGLIMMRRH